MLHILAVLLLLPVCVQNTGYTTTYLGCFVNGWYSSAFSEASSFNWNATVDWCVNYCASNGFRYAGLKSYYECHCGNDGYDRYGEGTRCDKPCAGNATQICGGSNQFSVYEIVFTSTTFLTTPFVMEVSTVSTPLATADGDVSDQQNIGHAEGNSDGVSKDYQKTTIDALSATLAVIILIAIAVVATVIIRRRRKMTLTHGNNINIEQQPPTVHRNTDTAAVSPNQYESLNAGEENHAYIKLKKEDNSKQADYYNMEMTTPNYYNLPAHENRGSDYCEIIG